MTLILRRVVVGVARADVRELITTRESMTPAHTTNVRPTVDELMQNYEIDEDLAEPTPRSIGVFDDLLTAGSHFRAVKNMLAQRFPGVSVIGIFIARRIFPSSGQEGVIEI